jgi:hypothetical protein
LTPRGQATEEPVPTDQMEAVPALRASLMIPSGVSGSLSASGLSCPGVLLPGLHNSHSQPVEIRGLRGAEARHLGVGAPTFTPSFAANWSASATAPIRLPSASSSGSPPTEAGSSSRYSDAYWWPS